MGTHERFGIGILVLLAMITGALLSWAWTPTIYAETLGPNLIANPSFETAGPPGLPQGWLKGGYGNNMRALSYPASPAYSGSRAARVDITSHVSGDAKWYFPAVAVEGGSTYRFSDQYIASVPSEIDVQVTHANGSVSYIVLGRQAPTSAYAQFTATFTLPADATKVTVFHVIDSVGSLTVDDYSLQKVLPQESGNLVANGDFENAGSGGLPSNWRKGGYGSNTRTFTYPAPGASGSGAKVSISSYASGDAKWYFAPITVSPGVYIYSDNYQSSVPSTLTVQFHHADGAYSYSNIAQLPPSGSFTNASGSFVVPSDVVDVTVFHVIQAVGSLTIDSVSLAKHTGGSGFPEGAVTLTFDDGWLSHYQSVVPKLKANGFAGTFYIVTRQLADYGFSGYVSKAQIQEMYADGMEIGAHTRTHVNLTTLSPAQQEDEIKGSRQDLLALSVGPVASFAYPLGAYSETTTSLVQSAGFTNARATENGYASALSDRYHLPRFLILNSTTPEEVKGWINTAAQDNIWLIISFHQVDTSGSTFSMTPSNFNTIVDYLKQKGIPVIPITEGVNGI